MSSGVKTRPIHQASAKPRRRVRLVPLLISLVISLLTLLALSPYLYVWWQGVTRMRTVESVKPHGVAIVFGAGLEDGRPSPYLVSRLQVALDLYEAGRVRVILVSGDNLRPPYNEPQAMEDWLISRGVPAERIVQDFAGEDTYTTCVRARQIFGIESAILISQTYHLPRAVTACRLVGVDVVGVGDDTVKPYADQWRSYVLREIPAIVKMVWDVVTKRVPILGPYETSVDDALGR